LYLYDCPLIIVLLLSTFQITFAISISVL
jgi:hypothetical protein